MIRLARVLILTLTLAAFAGGILIDLRLSEVSQAVEAQRLLLAGNLEKASTVYAQLGDSFGGRAMAGAGLAVVGALRPDLVKTAMAGSPVETRALKRMPNRVLLLKSLVSGDFESVLRLSDLLLSHDVDPVIRLYRSSALLEMGRVEEAARACEGIQAVRRSNRIGKRVGEVLRLLEENPHSILYDRAGRLLGSVTREGELRLAGGIEAGLVPLDALQDLQPETEGKSVRVSIDLELSRVARDALRGYRGSIVVLDATRGEILAAVCRPRTYGSEGFPPFHQLREPASISKVMTATAAFRAGLDPDLLISHSYCGGAGKYRGGILWCPCRSGPMIGLDHALAVSCNVAFADLGLRVGRSRLLRELQLYGFGRPEKSGLEFGRVFVDRGNQRQLADLSIGLEATGITPLHAALLAATFGNGGAIPEPTFVHGRDGLLGISPRLLGVADGKQVLDPAWLPRMLSAMEAVTEFGGSASGVVPPGFRFAMKTGTAADPRSAYHTNYIGVGPLPEPRIAFCVRITHEKTSSRVGRATRRVTRKLLRGIAETENWIPSLNEVAGGRDYRQDLEVSGAASD